MNTFQKIGSLFINLTKIYGKYTLLNQKFLVVIVSIFLLPIYFILVLILSILNLIGFLLLRIYIINKMFNHLFIVISSNPHTLSWTDLFFVPGAFIYYLYYFIQISVSLPVGYLCDVIAELISPRNHAYGYVWVWPSAFLGAHHGVYSEYLF
jgi:hypothetical protein